MKIGHAEITLRLVYLAVECNSSEAFPANLEPVEEARRTTCLRTTPLRAKDSRLCSFVGRFLLRRRSNYREGTIIAPNTLDRSFVRGRR